MTVQTPQEPGHFPTAPPWASTPDSLPPDPLPPDPLVAAPSFGGGYRHGQLLVRFPGEVHGSARPDAPSWRPVVVWTFFLGVLGVIPAMRRAGKARRYGRERASYWVAFGATLVAGAVFWSALSFTVALPLYRAHLEAGITEAVQANVLGDNRIAMNIGAATSASCTPEGDRGSDGLRTYLCAFKLEDGSATSTYIEADTRGNWEMSS